MGPCIYLMQEWVHWWLEGIYRVEPIPISHARIGPLVVKKDL
jgi:hypothetical protein